MEIEGQDGSRISIEPNTKPVLGRGAGFVTDDRTVSRRHVLLELETPDERLGTQTEPRVLFQVLGRNPIWVRSRKDGTIRAFKRLERGEVSTGDGLCVSSQRPVWFTLKGREIGRGDSEASGLESVNGSDSVDIANIDPVKEFGFLVMGEEFDQYPKNKIRDIRNWDWFLDEPRKDSGGDDDGDEDDVGGTVKRGLGRKRKKRKAHKNDDDDDWTTGSEGETEVAAGTGKVQRQTYATRSKGRMKPKQEVKKRGKATQGKVGEDLEEEEEEDETLGGFIVGDEDVELEEESESAGEEEEEELEDEDEDDED